MQYFHEKYYNSSLKSTNLDQIYEEFQDYQSLPVSVIPDGVHEEAKVSEGKTDDGTIAFRYRVDVHWWYLSHFQCACFH